MKPREGSRLEGPLAGLKVVEVAGLGPLTFTCMLLADMGADVVRIIRPGHDDMEKGATLRGRRTLALDLRATEGREVAIALVRSADVLLEGFRPGVMERLQLGPEQVMPTNPRLVYGRMTGWGQTGPRSAQAGHDINYIAVAGALHAIGDCEPVVPLNVVGDYGAGALYLAMGTLAAVLHARESGTGQVVDCAICDGTVSLLSLMHGLHHVGRWKDQRRSNTIDGAAPFYRTYRCKDGKAISVGAIEPQFYKLLLERLQLHETSLFARQHDRSLWGQQISALEPLFLTRKRDEWVAIFADCDACVAPVNSLEESLKDEHLLARQAFTELAGELQPSPAPRFSVSPSRVRLSASVANVEEILEGWQPAEKA
ncbi:CaiB/BaiF CoA-transferase family protein [Hydrogenophaga sp. YM1]|uniref:CaiB/BaiF CoA transferase family protein n=1 Tax=Hydrogenophaga sp. YM1 TaxID=2806262 RepID=UPI001EF6235D|nr:CaiB/BaiF CoA-transferase family protein [Hydrogenophaga sp. YM1]